MCVFIQELYVYITYGDNAWFTAHVLRRAAGSLWGFIKPCDLWIEYSDESAEYLMRNKLTDTWYRYLQTHVHIYFILLVKCRNTKTFNGIKKVCLDFSLQWFPSPPKCIIQIIIIIIIGISNKLYLLCANSDSHFQFLMRYACLDLRGIRI